MLGTIRDGQGALKAALMPDTLAPMVIVGRAASPKKQVRRSGTTVRAGAFTRTEKASVLPDVELVTFVYAVVDPPSVTAGDPGLSVHLMGGAAEDTYGVVVPMLAFERETGRRSERDTLMGDGVSKNTLTGGPFGPPAGAPRLRDGIALAHATAAL